MKNISLTMTQCRQIRETGHDLRELIESLEDQPDWITYNEPLSVYDIKSIQQGGCASGAYMPAVTYVIAADTMNECGNDVFTYIEDVYGELPQPPTTESWRGMAVFYLSLAIETWVCQFDLDGIDWE